MNTTQYAAEIAKELERTVAMVDAAKGDALAEAILGAGRVFVAGAGRSGLAARAFAMRLMHMGLDAYVVGETTTPGITGGDILVIGSGSGETGSLAAMAAKAKKLGAALGLVTIFPHSTIGKLADVAVAIPAPTPKAEAATGFQSIQPMGSLFEQSLLLVLDAVVLRLMELKGMDSGTMFGRHANLE